MKVTFLGTGAGEGYPGLWCECPHCSYARTHGGRNVRSNSCAVVDGKMLIDLGPAAFDNAARFGMDITHATTLLITHPHEDHLYPQHLVWRKAKDENCSLNFREKMLNGGARFTEIPMLNVYGNKYAIELLNKTFVLRPEHHMTYHTVQEGEMFTTDGYNVMPIRGNHTDISGFAHSYVIQKDGKTLLYALDSTTFEPDQMEIALSFKYDAIIMEGTYGLNESYYSHMCLANNIKMRKLYLENNCITEKTPVYLTHLSPHWCPPYDWYKSVVEPEGFTLAYDGMEIEV